MKINKLQILNFQGIRGKHEYTLDKHIYALCQKNGSGKTSFINAVRYGITGKKPAGASITENENSMAVGVTLDNGISYIRQEFTQKPAKFYMNSKAVRKQDIDRSIQSFSGVLQSTMNIASSSEVLAALTPQEFGSLLLSYIPKTLTDEKILSFLPDISESARMIVYSNLPSAQFGTEKITEFYNMCADMRRSLKKKMTELKPLADKFKSCEKMEDSSDSYKKQYNELRKSQEENIKKTKKKAEYDKILALRNERQLQIKELKKKLEEMKISEFNPEEREMQIKAFDEASKRQEDMKRVYYADLESVKTMEQALATIMQPVCPLSDKIKCTVDKSPVTEDIQAGIDKLKKSVVLQENMIKEQLKVCEEIKKKISEIDAANRQIAEARTLEAQIEKLEQGMPKLPENPGEIPDLTEITNRLNNILILYNKAVEYETQERVYKEYAAVKSDLEDYEYLAGAFAPRGAVNEKIAGYYISAFADECNKKAESIKPGMKIKFVIENGVTSLMDTDGSGIYKPYAALSGGERAYMLFLILDMLNSLTGYKTLILDELSVLDPESFRAFVKVLHEHQDEYDLILLSMADHTDMKEIIAEYGIEELEV